MRLRTGGFAAFVVALVVGLALVSLQSASAQEIPTTGTATEATGGQAHTEFIGDLKKFAPGAADQPAGPCNSAFAGYVVCEDDYDDDPALSPLFHVTPNPADDPLQHAWKVVFLDFHAADDLDGTGQAVNDIAAIQKEIFWVGADATTGGANVGGQRVWHEIVEARTPTGNVDPNVILTGAQCDSVMGAVGVNGTIADGLWQTGQASQAQIQEWINLCIQSEMGVHLNNWTVSKHLPPGLYEQCITLVHTNNAETPEQCQEFVILPLTHYGVDFDFDGELGGVQWTGLSQNNRAVHSGDFDLTTPGRPTIQGDGNTSLLLRARWAPLVSDDGKIIWSDFDIQVNRRNTGGQIVAWQHIDGIHASQTPGEFGDWVYLSGPVQTTGGGVGDLPICAEPNEPLKLDFSVTPRQTVFQRVYEGAIEIEALVDPQFCVPSLGLGEDTFGDDDVFDNIPWLPTAAPPPPAD